MNIMNQVQRGYNQVASKLEETANQIHEFVEPWHDVNAVMITQEDDCLECVLPCCCEGANKYSMLSVDPAGNTLKNVGSISEKSGCCARFCCQCFRPFQLHLNTDLDSDIEVKSEKPCKCPTMTSGMCLATFGCWCVNGLPFMRPEIVVSRKHNFIGKVANPFRVFGRSGVSCCPWDELDILDPHDNLKYAVSASCCQTGQCTRLFCCCLRCCVGNKLNFKILNAEKVEVGEIVNIYNGCYLETCTKQDKFLIRFPQNATYNEKILLIHAAIAIDFDIFEDTCPHLI